MIKERFRAKKESDIYYYADGGHSTHNTRPLMHGSRRANVSSSPLWAVGTQDNINRLLNAHDVTDVIAHDVFECQCRFHHRPLQGSFEEVP